MLKVKVCKVQSAASAVLVALARRGVALTL